MAQTPHPDPPAPAAGVGTPADDGGHVGSYTVPSDVMDQSSARDTQQRPDRESRDQPSPQRRFPVVGILVLFFVLFFVAWVTLHAGL